MKCGVGVVLVGGGAGAAAGIQIGNLVEDEGAQESEITAGGGKECVLAIGVPAGDAVLEFWRAVEGDFLCALDGPVLEDVVAAGGGVALGGGLVGATALESARDDAGVGAKRVDGG